MIGIACLILELKVPGVGLPGVIAAVCFVLGVFRGEVKRLWEYTFLEASPAMIDAGLSSKDEVEQLAIELDAIGRDDTTLVAQARLITVWGRKP